MVGPCRAGARAVHVVVMRRVSSDTISPLDGLVSQALWVIVPVLSAMLVVVGSVAVFIAVMRWTRAGRRADAARPAFFGAAHIVIGLFLPTIVGGLIGDARTTSGEGAPLSGSTAAPSPTSTPRSSPSPSAPPSQSTGDLTWLTTVLGIVAALILLVLLVVLVAHVAGRVRRSLRASRARAAAELATRNRLTVAWQGFHDRHNDLLRRILHAETDWDSLFSLPALTDPNVPETHAMLLAMRSAGVLRDAAGDMPGGLTPESNLADLPYPKSVLEFSVAWDAAERNARRLGLKSVPAAERKLIKEIRTLLDLAENGAASQTERSLSYRRALKLIESLQAVHVPPRAVAQLEERQQLAIEGTRS